MDAYYSLLSAPGAFWTPTLVLAGLFAVRYIVFAGIAWGLGYRRGVAERARKLQPAMPAAAQIGREIGYSTVAVAVFGAINGILAFAGVVPHTLLYRAIGQYGFPWFVVSIAVALGVHDTYFYWTHRLLHLRSIFPRVHRIHHLSTNPTPWTAYAFHPTESIVRAGGVVVILFVVPMHPLALILFQVISTAVNVYGHSGYELYPPGWSRHWLGGGSIRRLPTTRTTRPPGTITASTSSSGTGGSGRSISDYDRRYDEGRPPVAVRARA